MPFRSGNQLPRGKGPFVRRKELPQLLQQLQGSSSRATPIDWTTHCRVRNSSGSDVDEFSVLEITGSLITPTENEPEYLDGFSYEGDSVGEDDLPNFCIVQAPATGTGADPDIVLGVHAGVSHARLTGSTGVQFAGPRSGSKLLTTADSGPCVVLYDPGPAGAERIGIVRITGGNAPTSSSGGGGCGPCGGEFVAVGAGTDCGGNAMPAEYEVVGLATYFTLSDDVILEEVSACNFSADDVPMTCP